MYIVEIRVYSIMLQSSRKNKNMRILNINGLSVLQPTRLPRPAKTIEVNLIPCAYFVIHPKHHCNIKTFCFFRLKGPRPFRSY